MMLVWPTLKWWRRVLAIAATTFFIGMYVWAGTPIYNLPSRWIGYAGMIAIFAGMLLNPGSFGAPLPEPGWRGYPLVCKKLCAGGLAIVLVGFMLRPLGI